MPSAMLVVKLGWMLTKCLQPETGHGSVDMQLWTGLKAMVMLWESDESLATLPHWRHHRMLQHANLNYPSESSSIKITGDTGDPTEGVSTQRNVTVTRSKKEDVWAKCCVSAVNPDVSSAKNRMISTHRCLNSGWVKSKRKASEGPMRMRGAIAELLMPLHWKRPGCGQVSQKSPKLKFREINL